MKKAYTLTELLVIVVILAVLAAFVFPTFTQAKVAAKRTDCTSNLHQLYVASQLYINDNGDLAPMGDDLLLTRVYLGGTRLRCFAQNNPWRVSDYSETRLPILRFLPPAAGPEYVKNWWACRDIRGGEFPYVADANHANAMAGYRSGGDLFYLVARENGRIERVPDTLWLDYLTGRRKPPCGLNVGTLNL